MDKKCIYPDWEGGYIIGKHEWDKDGYCNVCGEKRQKMNSTLATLKIWRTICLAVGLFAMAALGGGLPTTDIERASFGLVAYAAGFFAGLLSAAMKHYE